MLAATRGFALSDAPNRHSDLEPLLAGYSAAAAGYDEMLSADGSVRFEGGHGFDNQLESMRALFVAHGPAFKQSRVVEPFANVDVYNVMAKILKLKPAPNDGNRATLKAVLR